MRCEDCGELLACCGAPCNSCGAGMGCDSVYRKQLAIKNRYRDCLSDPPEIGVAVHLKAPDGTLEAGVRLQGGWQVAWDSSLKRNLLMDGWRWRRG